MRRGFTLIFICLIISGFFTGCNFKYSTPEKTVNVFYEARKAGDKDAWFDCFTAETQDFLKKYWALPGVTEEEKIIKKDESLQWKIEDVRIENNFAEVKLELYSQTFKSIRLVLDLKKEGNAWKIDKKRDIEKAIELMMEEKIIEETLNNKE